MMAQIGGPLYQETLLTAASNQPSFVSGRSTKGSLCTNLKGSFVAVEDQINTVSKFPLPVEESDQSIGAYSADSVTDSEMENCRASGVNTFARQIQRVLQDDEFAYEAAFCPEAVLRLARKYQRALNGRNSITVDCTTQKNADERKSSTRDGVLKENGVRLPSHCCAKPSNFKSALLGMAQSGAVRESAESQNGAKQTRTFVARSPSAIKDALLRWCQAKTKGYSNVNITNFSSSWANGMAFCALIHHFYPEAFDFNTLDPNKRGDNFALAFKVAEDYAGIVPLLEVEDMLMMGDRPDYKCVFTYVQSFYRQFRDYN